MKYDNFSPKVLEMELYGNNSMPKFAIVLHRFTFLVGLFCFIIVVFLLTNNCVSLCPVINQWEIQPKQLYECKNVEFHTFRDYNWVEYEIDFSDIQYFSKWLRLLVIHLIGFQRTNLRWSNSRI